MARGKAKNVRTQKVSTANKSKPLLYTIFIAFAILIVTLVFSLNPAVNDKHASSIQNTDEFYGVLMKDIKTSGMGTVEADLDCRGMPISITCRAIIQMDSGETAEFKYTHDMTSQPCLTPGDRVLLEKLEGNSRVKVIRIGRSN